MTGTVYEDQFIFLIISHSFLLRSRYALDKRGEKTHIYVQKHFFQKLCRL
jgi:hypothetical protein